MNADALKRAAGEKAATFVEDGMRLGLGTGSTAKHFVDCVGEKVRAGFKLVCVPTSEQTRQQAQALGIPLTTLDETPELDLTVDGADELDAGLRLIKGGGGALLREKIVASASRRMIVVADASKVVETLGRFPLPIEIVRFGVGATRIAIERALQRAGCEGALILRKGPGEHVFVTDEGHVILDAHLNRIEDPHRLALELQAVPGIVEHGLFLGLAEAAIVATRSGIDIMRPA